MSSTAAAGADSDLFASAESGTIESRVVPALLEQIVKFPPNFLHALAGESNARASSGSLKSLHHQSLRKARVRTLLTSGGSD